MKARAKVRKLNRKITGGVKHVKQKQGEKELWEAWTELLSGFGLCIGALKCLCFQVSPDVREKIEAVLAVAATVPTLPPSVAQGQVEQRGEWFDERSEANKIATQFASQSSYDRLYDTCISAFKRLRTSLRQGHPDAKQAATVAVSPANADVAQHGFCEHFAPNPPSPDSSLWIQTAERKPTKEDADADGTVQVMGYLGSRFHVKWRMVVNLEERYPYWLSVPALPAARGAVKGEEA